MDIPQNLKYTASHEWIRLEEDGLMSVGITFHAQEALGDIVFIELPAANKKLNAGDTIAVVESVKAASDIYAPVAGEVVESNAALANAPHQVNENPYENWLFKMRPTDLNSIENLLDSEGYKKSIGV